MLFAQHLSLMIRGGVPLTEALFTLKKEVKSKKFQKTLDNILKKVSAGEKLARAMSFHSKIFDSFYQDIIRVGEESGTLEGNLKYLAQKLQKDIEMKKKIKAALVYPAIVIFLALAIIIIVAFFVLPKITDLFQALQLSLPLTTRILISSISFFNKYWIYAIIFTASLVFLLRILTRLPAVRFFLDKMFLSLPFFGKIFENLNLAFFARNFYTLLKSGIPLLDSLSILSQVAPNQVYANDLLKIRQRVERGEKISQGLNLFPKDFPPVFSEMVLVGEKSGTLEESFSYLSDYHEKESDQMLKNFSSLVEPILMILIGIFVGFVAIAIITPIYQFSGQLRFR